MVRIHEKTGELPAGTAYCLATEYQVKGGFTPKTVWVFETDGFDLEVLKIFVDDYFANILKTAFYVNEVPQDSALFRRKLPGFMEMLS